LIWQLEHGLFVRLENRGRQKVKVEVERMRRIKRSKRLFM
jgi:hypothetical protein